MAIYGQSSQFLRMLGQNLYSNPSSLTLGEYLEVGAEYPGLTMVQYLIDKGVPKSYTFSDLIASPDYFNFITDVMNIISIINDNNANQNIVTNYGQNSGMDIPQNGMSVEPQNKFMSYKPTNQTIGDFWDSNGYVGYPPVTWTDSNGDFHTFELHYVQSVLADGTLIFEAYDTNYGDYYWVAMRRSAHNSKNLEFVDALMWTQQFDDYGFDYTIKNSENGVTFFTSQWSNNCCNVISWTTTLTINNKNKLIAVDKELLISSNGLLELYNEVTGQSYLGLGISSNVYPITTFNDDFNQFMNGSKLGTFYFLVDEVDNGSGYFNIEPYENILAVNFLTGTYELINATAELQNVVDAGYFNHDWGYVGDAFWDRYSHPEGILFALNDDYSRNNDTSVYGVTRVWSPEWSTHTVGSVTFRGYPTPLTTRHLDDDHCCDPNGTYSSYSGYIYDNDSNDYWNLSPKHIHIFYKVLTNSGYGGPFGPIKDQVTNYIYRFELNPEMYNKEPELQSIPKLTGIKYPIISYSVYSPMGSVFSLSAGMTTNSDTYQFPTNNGMAFSNSGSYYINNYNPSYGSFDLSYWNDSTNNPVALGSNLGTPTNYTNNTVIQTVSSYSSYYNPYTVYPVNVDQYKGVKFGL